MDAGCDVLETCTFQSTRLRLDEWGLAEQTYAINYAAAQIARKVADRYAAQDGRPRYVAGSIGPTGKLPSSDDPALSDVTFDQLSDIFYEQAGALIEGGVDVLLVETSVDILEVKAALDGIRRARREAGSTVAVQAQIFLDLSGKHAAGHRGAGGDRDAGGDAGGRDRAELLDRAGAYARGDSLPVRARAPDRSRASPTPGCRWRWRARRSTQWSRSHSRAFWASLCMSMA